MESYRLSLIKKLRKLSPTLQKAGASSQVWEQARKCGSNEEGKKIHTTRTSSNYSATANLYNSQISTAPAVSSQADPWQRLLTLKLLQLPALTSLFSGEYSATELFFTAGLSTLN
jgi:hypothetical protein